MTQGNHSGRAHSICSASSAERWLNCPGSVFLSQQVPEPPPSSYALEGTRAHELAEKILLKWQSENFTLSQHWLEEVEAEVRAKEGEGEEYNGRLWSMYDFVLTYINLCLDEVDNFDVSPAIRIEQRLVLNEDMAMFGTADFMATGLQKGVPVGVIVDLKYGKGKRVEIQDNPQLAYYAVALKKCSKKKLEKIKVRVVQPRIDEMFSEQWYSVEELVAWEKKFLNGAEEALFMAGKLKTPRYSEGKWCWFCPGKKICPEIEKRLQGKLLEQFPDDL